MTPDSLAAKGFHNGRRHATAGGARSRRVLLIAAGLSVLLHLLPLGVFAVLPRGAPPPKPSEAQGEVELLMVEQKGSEPSQQGQPSDSPAEPSPAEKADATPPADKTPPLPAEADAAGEAVPPPPSPPKEAAKETNPAPEAPPPSPSPKGLEFNFAGTDSDSNAQVVSGHVLPALPDDRFRNRPPAYPIEAAMRGEAGSVVLMIHVSAYGSAAGVDVAESSGSATLDRAAVAAVRKWHFHPAMSDGQAVPFDMPFRFVFSVN